MHFFFNGQKLSYFKILNSWNEYLSMFCSLQNTALSILEFGEPSMEVNIIVIIIIKV